MNRALLVLAALVAIAVILALVAPDIVGRW